jgi:ADP-ribose pyrophosphatase YjhB (NUDIX family)
MDLKEKVKNDVVNVLKCNDNCCFLYSVNCFYPDWIPDEEWYKNNRKININKRIKKAGTFIIDPTNLKILIVQARGKYWGSPKGSIDEGETVKNCAIRETMEETGIKIDVNMLKTFTCIKGKCLYYDIEMKEFKPSVQTTIENNDANGIGWIRLECLKKLIDNKIITINQHLRLLIRKKFNIDLLS